MSWCRNKNSLICEAMNKLDGQVLASYKKMLEKQEDETQAPTGGKQSIFSPSKDKRQKTPNKTAYKTPLKKEIELQKYYLLFEF
jgi:hypothetical protein